MIAGSRIQALHFHSQGEADDRRIAAEIYERLSREPWDEVVPIIATFNRQPHNIYIDKNEHRGSYLKSYINTRLTGPSELGRSGRALAIIPVRKRLVELLNVAASAHCLRLLPFADGRWFYEDALDDPT